MKRKRLSVWICTLLILAMVVAPMTATAASQKNVVTIMKTTVDGGRLRAGPSSEYEILTSLDKGERVFYLNYDSAAFCLVRTSRGEIGFIYREFLEFYGAVRIDQIYYTTQDKVKVYKQPKTSATRVDRLEMSEHIIVYMIVDDWAYVRTLEGIGGFVQVSKLQKAV